MRSVEPLIGIEIEVGKEIIARHRLGGDGEAFDRDGEAELIIG